MGTGLAFACFSVAAMVARRREYLYLGGLLSSGLSMLLWLQFASSIFGGSTAIFKFEVRRCSTDERLCLKSFLLDVVTDIMLILLSLQLYFGLLIFVGYIVVDTQDIIEKAHYGDRDYVKHALTLFVDFVAVFVRILVIMVS